MKRSLAAGAALAVIGGLALWLIAVNPTTGALIVAALSVMTSPATAWLTFRWSRVSEKERWERERQSEQERFDRDEQKRRVLRGEDAAKEILTAVNEAHLVLSRRRTDNETAFGDLWPVYRRIRQQAELLTDDEVQARIRKIADNLYYYTNAQAVSNDVSDGLIAHTCSEAAHAILRAYLHGRPPPEMPRMDRLQAIHEVGTAHLEQLSDDEYDPLAPPEPPAPRNDSEPVDL